MESGELEYVGFWPRLGASLIDTILLGIITWPLLTMFYGESYWSSDKYIEGPMDFLLSWVFPAVAIVLFWIARQATPGKMAISAKIVDAKSGCVPSKGQLIGRYLAYYLSGIPFYLGFIWIAFDRRKQGWHDKLAGTVVVREK
ncbi:RDD family protein [Hydrogenimonas sp.]